MSFEYERHDNFLKSCNDRRETLFNHRKYQKGKVLFWSN